jgi:alpha-beta hydrolase superfamily lysophospholipase
MNIPDVFQHVVDELDLPDFAMFAWDARGHGMSALKGGDRPRRNCPGGDRHDPQAAAGYRAGPRP